MDTVFSLRIFRTVVELSSFAATADRLGISPAMVSKHISRLETEKRTRLLNRTSRSISLTEAGDIFYQSVVEALNALDKADALLGRQSSHPSGLLRITAPQWFSNPNFAQLISNYQNQYCDVEVVLYLDNQQHDLVADGFDLAIRLSANPSPTLIIRKIATMNFHLAASPNYLKFISGLKETTFILPIKTEIDSIEIEQNGDLGRKHLRKIIHTNDTSFILQMVRSSLGIGYLPEWLIEDELQSGTLASCQNSHLTEKPVYIAFKNRKHQPPKVRSFIDFVSDAFKAMK